MGKTGLYSALLNKATECRWSSSLPLSFQQETNLPTNLKALVGAARQEYCLFQAVMERISWLTVKHLWQLAEAAPAPV